MIIGITGTYRAGKGTVSDYLVEGKGFKHYSVSKFINEYLTANGIKQINREALIAAGNEIRQRFGADFIVKYLFINGLLDGGNIVIESIRNPVEAAFIKSQKDSFLFAVDADPSVRYERAHKLNGIKDHVTIQEFLASELKEFSSTNPNEQNLGKCIEMADYKFVNNEALEILYSQVDRTIDEILRGGKERRA